MRSDPFPKASASGGDVEPSVTPASLTRELEFAGIAIAVMLVSAVAVVVGAVVFFYGGGK